MCKWPCTLTQKLFPYKVSSHFQHVLGLSILYFIGPSLVIEINPTTLTVLDVSPYNTILIDCSVTQPQSVTTLNTIAWKQTSPSEIVQTLNHDGISTNITTTGLENSTSTSQLSVYASAAGRWRYTCSASLFVPGDPVISYSQTAEATVKGRYHWLCQY